MLLLPFLVNFLVATFPFLDYHWIVGARSEVDIHILLCLVCSGGAFMFLILPGAHFLGWGRGAGHRLLVLHKIHLAKVGVLLGRRFLW